VDQPFEVVFQLVFLASLAPLSLVLLVPLVEFFLAAFVPVFEASRAPWELSLLEAGALPE
jgi:hypothetical protein